MAEHLDTDSVPSRKRRRSTKSCEACRARKVKCDRGYPCKPCRRSRAALACSYQGGRATTSTPTRIHPQETPQLHHRPSPHGPSPHARETLNQLGSILSTPEVRGQDQPPHQGREPCNPRPELDLVARIDSLERTYNDTQKLESASISAAPGLRDLEERITRIEQHLETRATDRDSSGKGDGDPTQKVGLHVPLPRPYLRIGQEKTRLFGQNHWCHSLEQFQLLAKIQSKPQALVEGVVTDESVSLVKEAVSARLAVKRQESARLHDVFPDIAMTIPSKDICDACLDSYFRTYEPMFRILHEPSFRYRYQKYWEHPGIQSNGFMMQFVMVLAIGAVFLPQRLQSNLIRNFARDWAYACQWWLIGPTEREAMNIEGVQAFCLLILARQTNAVGGPSSIATDALLKLSFTIGLHLDPRTSSGLSDFQSDMRRRLWATVLELTAITSMQSTLPLLIPRDFQCRPPANIPDHDLKPDHIPDIYSSDTGSPGIDCSLQLLLLKSLPHRIQVIRQLNNVHESRSYEEALNASKTLNAHCREIHSFFHSRAETSEQLDFCSEFHQKFIDSYMRRLALFIVQPFAARAHKDSRFFEARKIRLESSLILASHTESLNLPAETLDDFSRMSMRGSGMFKVGLSQDVISAIGVEIITQINEETASADADNVTSTPQDPLAQLLKAKREPLIRTLEHIREQWQQIIALGRPSLKQYMFLTGMLARIKATEAGQEEGREMVPQAMTDRLKECITLLRESENLSPATNWTTSIETPSLASDPMGFFGFDFSGVDPSLCLDMPDWLPTNDNFAPSSLL